MLIFVQLLFFTGGNILELFYVLQEMLPVFLKIYNWLKAIPLFSVWRHQHSSENQTAAVFVLRQAVLPGPFKTQ